VYNHPVFHKISDGSGVDSELKLLLARAGNVQWSVTITVLNSRYINNNGFGPVVLCGSPNSRPIQSNSSAIEPIRTPIVRLPNSIEHNRTHKKILPIEHSRTFDYRTIRNRTQSNVRLPNDWYNLTSLLATLENQERVLAAARFLLLIII